MKMKQLQKMMKQAQSMQKSLEAEMSQLSVEGSSGGGVVTVTMDGKKNLKSIKISPDAVRLKSFRRIVKWRVIAHIFIIREKVFITGL